MNNINTSNLIDTKENKNMNEQVVLNYLNKVSNPFTILSAKDVSKDLHIGINQAYDLFKQEDFPTINILGPQSSKHTNQRNHNRFPPKK